MKKSAKCWETPLDEYIKKDDIESAVKLYKILRSQKDKLWEKLENLYEREKEQRLRNYLLINLKKLLTQYIAGYFPTDRAHGKEDDKRLPELFKMLAENMRVHDQKLYLFFSDVLEKMLTIPTPSENSTERNSGPVQKFIEEIKKSDEPWKKYIEIRSKLEEKDEEQSLNLLKQLEQIVQPPHIFKDSENSVGVEAWLNNIESTHSKNAGACITQQFDLMRKHIGSYDPLTSEFEKITGLDIGFKVFESRRNITNRLVIRLHVSQKVNLDALPSPAARLFERLRRLENLQELVAFDVIQADFSPKRRAFALDRGRRDSAVIQPGISISNLHTTAGTLGAIVFKENLTAGNEQQPAEEGGQQPTPKCANQPGILSAWHTLIHEGSQANDRIFQPAIEDGGRESDWIATLNPIPDHRPDSKKFPYDVAVAWLDFPACDRGVNRPQLGTVDNNWFPITVKDWKNCRFDPCPKTIWGPWAKYARDLFENLKTRLENELGNYGDRAVYISIGIPIIDKLLEYFPFNAPLVLKNHQPLFLDLHKSVSDLTFINTDVNTEIQDLLHDLYIIFNYFCRDRLKLWDLGECVMKSGRTTGITQGYVDGIGFYIVDYGGTIGRVRIEGFKVLPVQSQRGEVSAPGDSGAVWFLNRTLEGVGLHFDGERNSIFLQEHGLACHLPPAMKKLGLFFMFEEPIKNIPYQNRLSFISDPAARAGAKENKTSLTKSVDGSGKGNGKGKDKTSLTKLLKTCLWCKQPYNGTSTVSHGCPTENPAKQEEAPTTPVNPTDTNPATPPDTSPVIPTDTNPVTTTIPPESAKPVKTTRRGGSGRQKTRKKTSPQKPPTEKK